MTLWTPPDLEAATAGQATARIAATGVSIDTRTLRPGDLFVALRGANDGHAHLAEAFARGASGAMVHEAAVPASLGPLLRVRDTRQGLHDLGAAARRRFRGKVAAVTGSVGKTTTKEMLRLALGASGPTHAATASHNNHWGVPLTLARCPPDAEFLVAEIGMNHPGEIAPLSTLVRPHVAVVVSVEAAHIGQMGSLEAIAREKAAIAHGLEAAGTVILPGDHPLFPLLHAEVGHTKVIRFGGEACEAAMLEWRGDAAGGVARARVGGQEIEIRLRAPGRHLAWNALAALEAVAVLGADLRAAAAALEAFRPEAGRGGQTPILDGRATLLDESHNASAASIRATLAVLAMLPAKRRVAAFGDMRELGEFAAEQHAGLAGAVTASVDRLYTCGPLMRHLHDAVPEALRGGHAEDSRDLAALLSREVRPGDAVLVKGSFGSRMNVVARALAAL